MTRSYAERFPTLNIWRSAFAMANWVAGEPDAARHALSTAAPRGFDTIPRNQLWSTTLATASLVCAWLCDRDNARLLYDLLLPGANQYAILGFGVASFGSIAMHLGMLAGAMGRTQLALEHFCHALDQNERVGAHQWVIHTHIEKATMLLREDPRSVEGLAAADRARELAEDVGMTTILGRARNLLASHGG
jgi:hypothetical protein